MKYTNQSIEALILDVELQELRNEIERHEIELTLSNEPSMPFLYRVLDDSELEEYLDILGNDLEDSEEL